MFDCVPAAWISKLKRTRRPELLQDLKRTEVGFCKGMKVDRGTDKVVIVDVYSGPAEGKYPIPLPQGFVTLSCQVSVRTPIVNTPIRISAT